MKVALIGVTGRVGSRVAAELLSRGHLVTGIARHPESARPQAGLDLKKGDAENPSSLTPLLAKHDAVITATRFQTSDATALLAAVKEAGCQRLLVVGGAASLLVGPDKPLIETPDFPEAYKPEAQAGIKFLEVLRAEKELEWTFLSPSADFAPGRRKGQFRIGADHLLVDDAGRSWISMEDYAIALVDELEHPKHIRQRFTVGY